MMRAQVTEDGLPAAELARAAMEVLNIDSAGRLADALEMRGRNQDRTVQHWLAGQTRPSYDKTLRLLSIVGLINVQGPPQSRASIGEIIRDRRRRHGLTVEQLAAYAARAADANGWEQRDWAAAIERLERERGHYADELEEHVVEVAIIAAAKDHPEQERPDPREVAQQLLPLLRSLIAALEPPAEAGSD